MNPATQTWMPAVLSLFGTLIVVVFTAWLNTRALSAQMDTVRAQMEALRAEMRGEIAALRAEMKQGFAELRLEFHTQISELSHRVERLEDRVGLVQRP
ncbi:MAG TPA: hypothetical protein VL523_08230 [Terriglobia bacterium]|nr:hypothetical protein [Terriglobia bacterium]